MTGDAAPDLHADGADLALGIAAADPNAGVGGRGCVGDGEASAGVLDGGFEQGDVVSWSDVVVAQVDEGVGGELAGPVEGEVAATGGGVECC